MGAVRALGIICYALVMTGIGFFVGLRHGEIAKDDQSATSRARGIVVRSAVSWFIVLAGGGMITLFFWAFLYGAK